jgi:hypothetical protein
MEIIQMLKKSKIKPEISGYKITNFTVATSFSCICIEKSVSV